MEPLKRSVRRFRNYVESRFFWIFVILSFLSCFTILGFVGFVQFQSLDVELPFLGCQNNTDCPKPDYNDCLQNICMDGMCIIDQIPMTECYGDDQCKLIYNTSMTACNSSCMCEAIPFTCVADENCELLEATPCLESACISGRCTTRQVNGTECFSDSQCKSLYNTTFTTCNENCTCEAISSGCIVDANCDPLDYNPCLENSCISGTCTAIQINGTQCYQDSQCRIGLNTSLTSCDLASCSCIDVPFICNFDSDCSFIDYNSCLETVCLSGTCTARQKIGTQCYGAAQCQLISNSSLSTCDDATCTCTNLPFPQCSFDSDCGNLTFNTCLEAICISGVCTERQKLGTQCYTNSQCISTFNTTFVSCDSSCMCQLSSYGPGYGFAFTGGNFTSTGDQITAFTLAFQSFTEGDWIFIGNYVGSTRTANAIPTGNTIISSGVTFVNDTWTVTSAGNWKITYLMSIQKASGGGARTIAFATRKNASTATVNQSSTPVVSSSISSISSNAIPQLLEGTMTFSAVPGDTFRLFGMMSVPGAGNLNDIAVNSLRWYAEKWIP